MADRSSWKSVVLGAFAAVVLGGLLGSAAQGQSTAYTYDGLGRLSSAIYSDGKTITYTYDAAGNRTQRVVSGEDLTPNAFDLGPPVSNATAGARYTSASPALSGFNSPLSASVTGGEYRIDGGDWQTTTRTVRPGQTVQVQVLAPTAGGESQTATLTIGGVSENFTVTTLVVPDYTPDPVSFLPFTPLTDNDTAYGVPRIFQVTGINQPITLAIRRFNESSTGNIANRLLRVQTGPTAEGPWTLRNEIGGPGTHNFPVTNGTWVNLSIEVSTSSGRATLYYDAELRNVTTGDIMQSFYLNGVVDNDNNYNVPDYDPDPASFANLTLNTNDPAGYTDYNMIQITGINQPITLRVTRDSLVETGAGGFTRRLYIHTGDTPSGPWTQYALGAAAGAYVDMPVVNGQYVYSIGYLDTNSGRYEATWVNYLRNTYDNKLITAWRVTGVVDANNDYNLPSDTTPDPFDLGGPVAGATAGSWVTSDSPTITGINTPAPVSITGGQYRINGGTWQTGAGTVTAGQTVQVQAQAPAGGGASQTATLTIGGVGANFTVTTQAAPDYTPDPLNWNDLSINFRGRPNGQPAPLKYVDGTTLPISGLSPGLSITLSFGQDTISPGATGLIVIVYKNGVPLNPLSLSVPDGSNVSRGPAGLTVSVTNGDTIRFRAEVFDSAILRNSGNASDRSARQLVYNQTTSSLIDTFDIYGSYEEPTYCGQQEC